MASKRKKTRFSFTPEAIEARITKRTCMLKEVNEILNRLKDIDTNLIMGNKIEISEKDAMSILCAKIGFEDVMKIKIALDHVPSCYNMTPVGSNVCIRISLISQMLESIGIRLPVSELQHYISYLEWYCPTFLSNKFGVLPIKVFDLSKTNHNTFLAPPVTSCLSCGKNLQMHNPPSKAIVFGINGPLPSTKVTLECRDCQVRYGISKYADAKGQHYYPKTASVIEVSNVTYIEESLYKWIPSLG